MLNRFGVHTILGFFWALFVINSPACLSAQESSSMDSLSPAHDEYIQDHKNQLNIKFEVGNEVTRLSTKAENRSIYLEPNLNLRYGLVFSYKFLSVRLGIRPKISDAEKENKGESDTFRFRIQLLFDNWSHLIEYNKVSGYYVTNTLSAQSNLSGYHIQYPDLTTHVISGFSAYKLNRNYSFRSVQSQTEIQVKSAGSFMPGIRYKYYVMDGADLIKTPDGDIFIRDEYYNYTGFNLAASFSYYYTHVWKRHWYLNAFAGPSVGYDFYKSTLHKAESETTARSFKEAFLTFNYGFGGGYNGEKIFFGAMYNSTITSEKFDATKIVIQGRKNVFSVFLGYRFKAPKQIAKPVDLIEEKVPMLQEKPSRQ